MDGEQLYSSLREEIEGYGLVISEEADENLADACRSICEGDKSTKPQIARGRLIIGADNDMVSLTISDGSGIVARAAGLDSFKASLLEYCDKYRVEPRHLEFLRSSSMDFPDEIDDPSLQTLVIALNAINDWRVLL